jgi:hypothetical protein
MIIKGKDKRTQHKNMTQCNISKKNHLRGENTRHKAEQIIPDGNQSDSFTAKTKVLTINKVLTCKMYTIWIRGNDVFLEYRQE